MGDFGCGKALIMNKLGNRIFSYDHYAIDERVTSCDMKSVPLPSKSLEIIVFCLSLMGTNWQDYIKEARRCLVTNGTLLIAETTHSLEEGRLSNLVDILAGNNFEIYSKYEIEPFTFLEATKRESFQESAK